MKPRRSNLNLKALSALLSSSLLMAFSLPCPTEGPDRKSAYYLHTSGSRILDASNRVVGLSGVNWFGFETSERAPHGLSRRNWEEMLDQVKSLGYNVIRIPFANAMLRPESKPNAINYKLNPDLEGLNSLEVMDKIIAGATERDIRIILDNHRSTFGGGPESNGFWYTSAYPEDRWIEDWKLLAARYKDTAVIGMDLRNEPYSACWGCGDKSKDWRLAAEKAGNAVLSVNPQLLIIVEGIAHHNGSWTWWGGNLIGAKAYPVRLDVPNQLVYSAHDYPATVYPQSWFYHVNYPANLPGVWDSYWGYLVKEDIAPVLVGEFGTRFETKQDQQWLQAFQEYIRQNNLSWTFWSLNPDSGDTGGLLLNDWVSVHEEKQAILEDIQFPLPESRTLPTVCPSPWH